MTVKMDIIAMDLMGAWEKPAQGKTAPKEDIMRFRSCVTALFSLLLFSLPEANAQDVSEGRNFFISRCIACHAFTCNKDGPRLGGLFGRKSASVEDYGSYSQDLKNFGIVWTEETLDAFFTDPAKITPTGTMATNGKIDDAAQRQQLIAFLKTEDPTVNLCPQG
jgi:cytochrome c